MKSMDNIEILKVKGKNVIKQEDLLIVEYPFTISLNGKEIITLLSSPISLKSLSLGFLYSEGYINDISDIEKIQIDKEEARAEVWAKYSNSIAQRLVQKKTITSGSTKGTNLYDALDSLDSMRIKNPLNIEIRDIKSLLKEFSHKSKLFLDTGGAHSCALATKTRILMFEEDIARHNTFDKIIGKSLMEKMDFSDKIIFTSGRISSEMLLKIARVGIPVIVSVSAPTDLSVRLARQLNITLIGFARGENMNIYSNLSNFGFEV